MPNLNDIILILLVIAATIATPIVVQLRRRSHARFLQEFAETDICQHLRQALKLLTERGHRVMRAGQLRPNMPLEIHVSPPFDPRKLAEELNLSEPVFVSDRNALCCRKDWCEIHPSPT